MVVVSTERRSADRAAVRLPCHAPGRVRVSGKIGEKLSSGDGVRPLILRENPAAIFQMHPRLEVRDLNVGRIGIVGCPSFGINLSPPGDGGEIGGRGAACMAGAAI